MAKLPEEGYIISIGTEGYWVSDGFAELLIRLLRDGESSNVVLTTKTAIQNEKMELTNENKRLKEELELVRDDNTMFEEDVKELKNDLEESQHNNVKLSADVKALEVRFDIVSAASIGFRKDIQKLQEENIKLMNVCNYLQKRNEGLSGSVEMIKKENKELKEQLEASSDLTMTNELANIFAEYTVADQKNRDDLGDKITEFRRKYGLE